MKPRSIFWVIDYIKAHRDKETRYEIDLYLLRLGYDAGTIDDAWQIAGLDLARKGPPFYKWLFPVGLLCNVLGWWAIFAPWQSAVDRIANPTYGGASPFATEFYSVVTRVAFSPIYLYAPLVLWTIINILVFFTPAPTIKYIKRALASNLLFISFALVCDLTFIALAFNNLTWQGPVLLTLFLAIAWVCSFIELKYIPKKIEVVLPAHSSQ
ncbi:MAG: hypothetical protein J0I20_10790 [Chloroflexi bacterium]|nr:hypothetical protein [Chloroflexota bacterium]OJV94434.1 MAG: hypothetical protein BGO39_22000 [Chloroflexi bacterium 54-19]